MTPGIETILVVDDERWVLEMTTMMLTRHGYTVLTAMSGTEAVALFKNFSQAEIDLLIVNLVMTGMNGLETVRRIREMRPDIPVLYWSAYEELKPEGGIPYLAKPFTSVQLVKKIREVLDAG